MEIAHLYYGAEWRVDSNNLPISAGGTNVVYNNSSYAECPYNSAGWISGTVPYCWSKGDEIYKFFKYMVDGKGAGNIASTTGPAASNLVSGVDCSGYITQILKQPTYYMVADLWEIASNIGWNDLAPGDITTNEIGTNHVRFIEEYPYGGDTSRVKVYESTTAANPEGVRREIVAYSSNYIARRYKNISSAPSILSVLQNGAGSVEIKWFGDVGDANGNTAYGFRIYQSTDGSSWNRVKDESQLKLVNQSVIITGLSSSLTYYFKISAFKPTGESGFSDVYAVKLDSIKPKVLIVDGYDRWLTKTENPNRLNNNFVVRYAQILNSLGITFETVDNMAITRSADSQNLFNLNNYTAIMYMLGDEGAEDYALNFLEETAIVNYLAGGGQLFISGSQISEDLMDSYSDLDNLRMNDATFYRNYLKINTASGNAGTHTISRGAGIFSSITGFSFDDGSVNYDVSAPDIINPVSPASANLYYSSSSAVAGIQFEGKFGSGTTNGKIVYLGFPFESITNESTRNSIMGSVASYFNLVQAGQCLSTDASCGVYPNCSNCNSQDGCNGTSYRDYKCSGDNCVYTEDGCTDCSCSCGGYNTTESTANNNCSDGKDNDCDGATDSSDTGCQSAAECISGQTASCSTGMSGICSQGTKTCQSNGTWGSCVQNSQPASENCTDSQDNDCDNNIDCQDSDCSSDSACESSPPPSSDVPSDYVAYWRLDGNTNDELGTSNGMVFGSPQYASGAQGQAVSLNGTGDYVNISPVVNISALPSYTISTWVKNIDTGSNLRFSLTWSTMSGSTARIVLGKNTNHRAYFSTTVGSGNYATINVGPLLNDNQWHLLTAVKLASDQFYLYVDSVQVGQSIVNPGTSETLTTMLIGARKYYKSGVGQTIENQWLGNIDEVMIYSRALSDSEIQNIYNAQKPGVLGKLELEKENALLNNLASIISGIQNIINKIQSAISF